MRPVLPLTKIQTVYFDREVDSALLPGHLAVWLRSVEADTVEVMGNRVTFTAGLFRIVGRGNILAPFGFGYLTVISITAR